MNTIASNIAETDPVWERIREDAVEIVSSEPVLAGLVYSAILTHENFESAIAYRLAQKLASGEMTEAILNTAFADAYAENDLIGIAARSDTLAIFERDPACNQYIQPLLFYKGFQAIQAYRIAKSFWEKGQKNLAYFIQMRASEVYGVDIHPAATIGRGLMIDHAHAVVIGETAVVGDNVSMLHSVTLGGTGKDEQDRHPKVGDNVLLGAGAKILGNITVGACSRVAAGSVVLADVPPCKTVAGVPARVVGDAGCDQPSVLMNQLLEK